MCIVKGCNIQCPSGKQVCKYCEKMLISGKVPNSGKTFIHDLRLDYVFEKRLTATYEKDIKKIKKIVDDI